MFRHISLNVIRRRRIFVATAKRSHSAQGPKNSLLAPPTSQRKFNEIRIQISPNLTTRPLKLFSSKHLLLTQSSDYSTKAKKVHEWTTDDVVEWARTELDFSDEHTNLLRSQHIRGGNLLSFSSVDRVAAIGLPLGLTMDLWGGIQKLKSLSSLDIYDALQQIASSVTVPSPSPLPFRFSYVADDRWVQVQEVFETLLRNNFFNWTHAQQDKQKWCSLLIQGAAGIGKTRFCVELPKLMKEFLQNRKETSEIVMNNLAMATDLAGRLDKVNQIYMNIGMNGAQITRKELEMLEPTVMLGIRVAHGYWFKDKKFDEFREKIMQSPQNNQFTLDAVLKIIAQEPTAQVLHLIIDEFQLLLDFISPFSPKESLVKSLNRSLVDSIANSTIGTRTFVIPTFCGTGFTDTTVIMDPTLYKTQRILLPPLSQQAMENLSQQITYQVRGQIITGAQWKDRGLDKLLYYLGGLPRAVEGLNEILQDNYYTPDKDSYDHIYSKVEKYLRSRISSHGWLANAGLLPHIAISGCAVPSNWKFQTKYKIQDIELRGLIQLLPTAEDFFVVNLPLIFITNTILTSSALGPLLTETAITISDQMSNVEIFHQTQEDFEYATNLLFALRFNVAVALSKLNGQSTINPAQVFAGIYGNKAFLKMGLLQIPVQFMLSANGTRSKWVYDSDLSTATSLPHIITTDYPENRNYDITDFNKLELIQIGGQNIFDGVLKLKSRKEQILVWIDAKFTNEENYLAKSEVAKLIAKRDKVQSLLPGIKHYLLVVSNKKVGKDSEVFQLIENTERAGLIYADNMQLAFSPVYADILKKKASKTSAK